jgi:hypothetical protein
VRRPPWHEHLESRERTSIFSPKYVSITAEPSSSASSDTSPRGKRKSSGGEGPTASASASVAHGPTVPRDGRGGRLVLVLSRTVALSCCTAFVFRTSHV